MGSPCDNSSVKRGRFVKKTVFISLQVFIGLIFVTTAIGKLLDNRGFAIILETYQLFPSVILLPLGLGISLFELLLGYFLLTLKRTSRYMPLAALFSLVSYAGYLVLAIVTNLRGLALTNCGCFGVFLARPMTWWTVLEDAILMLVCFMFWRLCASYHRTIA